MAPRYGKRPARDLIQDAKFRDDTARGLWRVHRKVCRKCDSMTVPGRDCCDEGWELLKGVTRTGNRLRTLTGIAAAQGVQGELW